MHNVWFDCTGPMVRVKLRMQSIFSVPATRRLRALATALPFSSMLLCVQARWMQLRAWTPVCALNQQRFLSQYWQGGCMYRYLLLWANPYKRMHVNQGEQSSQIP